MRRALALAGWILACASGAAIGQGANADGTLLREGERIAKERCGRCHAIGKTGDSPLKAAPAFRTLSQRYPIEDLAEPLSEGIVTAHRDMPQFVFTADEIDAFLGYLESINPPHVPPAKQ